MKTTHFGTDGIRGIYGETLTEETAYRLGAALGKTGSVLIGRDNRPSSPSLARALAEGIRSVGGDFQAVGVITTPALYYLLSISEHANAVMVTASHNPPEHNGLKVFTQKGKPTENERHAIEGTMMKISPRSASHLAYREKHDLFPYIEYLKRTFGPLNGIKVVLDCAGGAASVFKGVYRDLGAEETTINARENGDRINVDCGALHPETCAREVLRVGADIGVSVDGDGDRIAVVTRSGKVLDGDRVTYLLACRMKEKRRLNKNRVAMTVMTNGGIIKSLTERGITVTSTAVGDAALAETMKLENINLGGEQSGHVILGDYLPTGDGLAVGAALMKSILEEGDLESAPVPIIYPQVLLNIPVKDRTVASDPEIRWLAEQIEEELKEGRILLRASGTESVIRIMAEHPDEKKAKLAAVKLKEAVLRHA